MKFEIQNKKLINQIEAEAEATFISKEALLKQILVERYGNVEEVAPRNTDSIEDLKDEAEELGSHISRLLRTFADKYGVNAEIKEADIMYVGNHNEYYIKVEM